MTFTFADPMQLWLKISTSVQASAWQHSQAIQSSGGRWQVYLNQLCLRTLLDWIQSEKSVDSSAWPLEEATPASWELVNGSAIAIGDKKLALIPTEGVGHDELEVPQEWIDIDSWAADYYLALQVNVEEGWLECWGYTTHQRLKALSEYDSMERLYIMSAEVLGQDINALWTTLEFCPTAETQAALEPFANLSNLQAEGLIERLSKAEFPRLSIPFVQWGALLNNATWYQQLQAQRLNVLLGESTAVPRLSLSEYLIRMQDALLQGTDSIMSAGWQSVEAVFGAEAPQLAFSFREAEQTAGKQAKQIQLGSVASQPVRLVLLWQQEADERIAVQAQLYPDESELYLPPEITFSLISDADEVLQSIQSGEENNYIQLKRFRCPIDYAFGIEVQLDEVKVTERFVA